MKILTSNQVRAVDQFTIENEPIGSIDLMERAALACSEWLQANFDKAHSFKFFCGLGNNGGDGLTMARLMAHEGYQIEVFVLRYQEKASANFDINRERLKELPAIRTSEILDLKGFPVINDKDIVIDALLGSGLSRPIDGMIKEVVERINHSKTTVVSIDIPSGLYSDIHSDPTSTIVKADYTLCLELPKLAFMHPENSGYVGNWVLLPIGLHTEGIALQPTKNIFLAPQLARQLLKPRAKFSHKGVYGHALLIAGSYGKIGAASLAARACLRAGAGLLTVHIPKCGYEIIQSTLPEAMVNTDTSDTHFSDHFQHLSYTAVGIGPGLGKDPETQKALKLLLQSVSQPLVMDADALNILADNPTWLSFLPANTILTPHPKEFERLAGKSTNDFERQQQLVNFSVKYKVYVLLKGAHSIIACPDGSCYFNASGNPGMATAGSGDVLTGVILSLLAQHYTPLESALLGTFIHGRSGDMALENQSMESLIASDIIENLGAAFKSCRTDV